MILGISHVIIGIPHFQMEYSGPKFPYKQPSKIKDIRLVKTKFKTRNLKYDFINVAANDYCSGKF